MRNDYRLIAFDLDGTLTQSFTLIENENLALLRALSKTYRLLVVSAGSCERIHAQLGGFPLDILGNYGMQCSTPDAATGAPVITHNITVVPDRKKIEAFADALRRKHGLSHYVGDSVKYQDSGMFSIALAGTAVGVAEKLAFDPDRSLRLALLADARAAFPKATVFVAGAASLDVVPAPYNKLYALDRYCAEHGLSRRDVLFCGDDYATGGNDEQVFLSDIDFVKVDDYRRLPQLLSHLIE